MRIKMYNSLLLIWIPLLLIILAPVLQITFLALKRRGKITSPFWAINLITFVAGFPLSGAATLISIMGIPMGIKCATGCVAFIGIGFFITLTVIPLVALFNYLAFSNKQKLPEENQA
jgi:hypothetical protein